MVENERKEILRKMRKEIYMNECMNLSKKNPEKDSVMVDKIINTIKKQVLSEKDLEK